MFVAFQTSLLRIGFLIFFSASACYGAKHLCNILESHLSPRFIREQENLLDAGGILKLLIARDSRYPLQTLGSLLSFVAL